MAFYVSPFRILGQELSDSLAFDQNQLAVAKKKLLAEIESSNNRTILVGKGEWNQTDVVQFFDTIQETGDMAYHQAIYQDKALLTFLESGELNPKAKFIANSLYLNVDFGKFISPYFTESVLSLFSRSVQNRDLSACKALFENASLIHAYYTKDSYAGISKYLQGQKNRLEVIYQGIQQGSPISMYVQELTEAYNFYYISILNSLPLYFEEFRDEYAKTLMNISTHIWNKTRQKEVGRSIIYGLSDLQCSQFVKAQIQQNQKVMNDAVIPQDNSDDGGGGISIWGIIGIIVFLIKLLLMLA